MVNRREEISELRKELETKERHVESMLIQETALLQQTLDVERVTNDLQKADTDNFYYKEQINELEMELNVLKRDESVFKEERRVNRELMNTNAKWKRETSTLRRDLLGLERERGRLETANWELDVELNKAAKEVVELQRQVVGLERVNRINLVNNRMLFEGQHLEFSRMRLNEECDEQLMGMEGDSGNVSGEEKDYLDLAVDKQVLSRWVSQEVGGEFGFVIGASYEGFGSCGGDNKNIRVGKGKQDRDVGGEVESESREVGGQIGEKVQKSENLEGKVRKVRRQRRRRRKRAYGRRKPSLRELTKKAPRKVLKSGNIENFEEVQTSEFSNTKKSRKELRVIFRKERHLRRKRKLQKAFLGYMDKYPWKNREVFDARQKALQQYRRYGTMPGVRLSRVDPKSGQCCCFCQGAQRASKRDLKKTEETGCHGREIFRRKDLGMRKSNSVGNARQGRGRGRRAEHSSGSSSSRRLSKGSRASQKSCQIGCKFEKLRANKRKKRGASKRKRGRKQSREKRRSKGKQVSRGTQTVGISETGDWDIGDLGLVKTLEIRSEYWRHFRIPLKGEDGSELEEKYLRGLREWIVQKLEGNKRMEGKKRMSTEQMLGFLEGESEQLEGDQAREIQDPKQVKETSVLGDNESQNRFVDPIGSDLMRQIEDISLEVDNVISVYVPVQRYARELESLERGLSSGYMETETSGGVESLARLESGSGVDPGLDKGENGRTVDANDLFLQLLKSGEVRENKEVGPLGSKFFKKSKTVSFPTSSRGVFGDLDFIDEEIRAGKMKSEKMSLDEGDEREAVQRDSSDLEKMRGGFKKNKKSEFWAEQTMITQDSGSKGNVDGLGPRGKGDTVGREILTRLQRGNQGGLLLCSERENIIPGNGDSAEVFKGLFEDTPPRKRKEEEERIKDSEAQTNEWKMGGVVESEFQDSGITREAKRGGHLEMLEERGIHLTDERGFEDDMTQMSRGLKEKTEDVKVDRSEIILDQGNERKWKGARRVVNSERGMGGRGDWPSSGKKKEKVKGKQLRMDEMFKSEKEKKRFVKQNKKEIRRLLGEMEKRRKGSKIKSKKKSTLKGWHFDA